MAIKIDAEDPLKIKHLWQRIFSLYHKTRQQSSIYFKNQFKQIVNIKVAGIIIFSTNPAVAAQSLPLANGWLNPKSQLNQQIFTLHESQQFAPLFLKKPLLVQTVRTPKLAQDQSITFTVSRLNLYPFGYCTWWIKNKRQDIPNNLGDARNWLTNAPKAGLQVTSQPTVGGIVVTNESPYGHLAYIEAIRGNNLIVSEMNYAGWGKKTQRILNLNNPKILGFIN